MAKTLFIFAPGAGAPSSHQWMKHWALLLRKIGKVRILDYPYVLQKRKLPDRLPILIASHRAALAKVRKRHKGPIVLIGKSMGSRVGCHVALEEKVRAVIQDGDHSLLVAKRTLKATAETQADVDARALKRIETFVNSLK